MQAIIDRISVTKYGHCLEAHLLGQRGQWGDIATRYAKTIHAFVDAVQVCCIAICAVHA